MSGLRSLVWLDICHNPIEDFSPAYDLSARIILGNAERPSRRGHYCAPPLADPSERNSRTRFLI